MFIFYFVFFSDWTGPGIKLYNIVNFENLIRESARIEPLSAISLSILLRTSTSENAIEASKMRLKSQMPNLQSAYCGKFKQYMQKEEEIML